MAANQLPKVLEKLTLSSGEQIELVVPLMRDVFEQLFLQGKPWLSVVIQACTKREWSWFLNQSLDDGAAILKAITPVVHKVMAMMQTINNTETKH